MRVYLKRIQLIILLFAAWAIASLCLHGCATAPVITKAPTPEAGPATVSAVGDVMLYSWPIENVYEALEKLHKKDKEYIYKYPFKRVKPYLQGIVFCNMEGPLTDHPPVHFTDKDEIFYFSVPSRFGKSMKSGGFKVISVANNHIKDCGIEGIRDSIKNLKDNGILAVGAGENNAKARKPVLMKENGVRIAFLAYDLVPPKSVWADDKTPGAAHADTEGICKDVKEAKKISDVVLVSVHWGHQIYHEKDISPSKQRKTIAHAIIDAGATAVLGAHSHAVEKIEEYHGGVIFYGLGNFLFGSTYKKLHPYSIIAQLKLGPKGLLGYKVLPVLISPPLVNYCPKLLEGKDAEEFLAKIKMNSSKSKNKPNFLH